jgi:hypothetical protein
MPCKLFHNWQPIGQKIELTAMPTQSLTATERYFGGSRSITPWPRIAAQVHDRFAVRSHWALFWEQEAARVRIPPSRLKVQVGGLLRGRRGATKII